MSGHGTAACKLCVAVHTAHRVRHAVTCGTRCHIIGVQRATRAAARRNREILFAVIPAPFFISACNRVLETGGVSAVAGDGNVHAFVTHNGNAFVDVVCAVATHFCAFAVAVSGGFYDFESIGVLVVLGLNVGEPVDTADDVSRVFAEAVKNYLQRLFTNFICRARDADSAFCRRKTFVTGEECKAFCFVAQEHCGEIAVSETDFAVFGNRTGNAEGLQTYTDCLGGVGGFFAVFLYSDSATDGVSPYRVIESDWLNAFYERFAIYAFIEADFLRFFEGRDAIFFKDAVDFVNASFVTFKSYHSGILQLFLAGVDVFGSGGETAVTAGAFFECFVGGSAFFNHIHHFSEVHEFVTDDFAFFVKTDAGNVAFGHFEIAHAFFLCGKHSADLTSQTFTEVFERSAYHKSVVGKRRLSASVNDLQEKFAHGGVDGVAYKVGIQRFENGFPRKNFGSHSRGMSHAAAT